MSSPTSIPSPQTLTLSLHSSENRSHLLGHPQLSCTCWKIPLYLLLSSDFLSLLSVRKKYLLWFQGHPPPMLNVTLYVPPVTFPSVDFLSLSKHRSLPLTSSFPSGLRRAPVVPPAKTQVLNPTALKLLSHITSLVTAPGTGYGLT